MPSKKAQPKRKVPAHKIKPVHQSRIKIQRILVPIDFSEHSKNALKYAIPFAEKFKASIDLIYVVEPTIYPADFSFGQIGFPNVEEELHKRGCDELENLITKEIAGKVPSRKNVRIGKPFYEINQYASGRKYQSYYHCYAWTHRHGAYTFRQYGGEGCAESPMSGACGEIR